MCPRGVPEPSGLSVSALVGSGTRWAMRHHRSAFTSVVLVAAFALGACSSDDQANVEEAVEDAGNALETAATEVGEAAGEAVDDAAEAAVRNLAAEQGEEQFADAGHPLDGDGLSCEATVADDATNVSVSCMGTTEAGTAAALTGTTNELPGASLTELEGSFTGTVDGAEVFQTDSLGG